MLRYIAMLIATIVLLVCCAVGQQTAVTLQFFGADFNSQSNYPGVDGQGKSAVLKGIRLWDNGVKWSQVETSRQVYNWTKLDAWVNAAEAQHQDVLYTFGATPQWAAQNSQTPPPNCSAPDVWACAVPNESDWKEYVTTLATRYKGRIAFYELWNEPDYPGFFSGTPTQLSVMCTDAAAIIRATDPDATILSPSFHGPTMATKFHALVQAQKWQLMFDTVNVHMRSKPNYPPENFLTVWGQVTAELALDKISAHVWDDEHGILSTDNVTDPDVLASYVARELLLRASVPVQRQYIYFWDGRQGTGLQKNASGTAWNVVAGWLLNQATTKTTVSGSIYTVHIGKGVALWNSSLGCAAGKCTTAAYALGKTRYRTQTDITGAKTAIVNNTVQLGVKPIYLQ